MPDRANSRAIKTHPGAALATAKTLAVIMEQSVENALSRRTQALHKTTSYIS